MFGWERLWHKLLQLMSQKTHPEATMLKAFKAMKTASAALPEWGADLVECVDEHLGGELALTSCLTMLLDP